MKTAYIILSYFVCVLVFAQYEGQPTLNLGYGFSGGEFDNGIFKARYNSNLIVFARYITETGEKDWEIIKQFNDKLMIISIAHIQNKCLIAGDFTITFTDNQAKNFYFFSENKYEIYSWIDTKYIPRKCITNPAKQNEVIIACRNNEVVFTSGVSNDITLQKPKIKTKNFLRDIDISQNGQFLIVGSSSGYVETKPNEKGYAKIEIYDWIDKKKIIEF